MKVVFDLPLTSTQQHGKSKWSPAKLFSSGYSGAWLDPSDLSILFQDSAGTIPVTHPDQPAGLTLDKTGNGHDAVQATASARPVYRPVGGRHFLEFDGVDDHLTLATTLDMDAGHLAAGIVEPEGVSNHSGILSASASGHVAITSSGASRSLGKNAGGVINIADSPGFFPMTHDSAVAVRIPGFTIYAKRAAIGTEHYNATEGSANLGQTNTLMAFSSGGQFAATAEVSAWCL